MTDEEMKNCEYRGMFDTCHIRRDAWVRTDYNDNHDPICVDIVRGDRCCRELCPFQREINKD